MLKVLRVLVSSQCITSNRKVAQKGTTHLIIYNILSVMAYNGLKMLQNKCMTGSHLHTTPVLLCPESLHRAVF